MIKFKSKITKSIIIAIFILSLTISIYIVPASAIVSGGLDVNSLSQIFDQRNYGYYQLYINGYYRTAYSSTFVTKKLYPYIDGITLVDPESVAFTVFGRSSADTGDLWYYTPGNGNHMKFTFPLGLRDTEQITLKFYIVAPIGYSSTIFAGLENNSIYNGKVGLGCYLADGTYMSLNNNTFEFSGISQYGNSLDSDGNEVMWEGKLYEITLNRLDVNSIYINFYFDSILDHPALNSIICGLSTVDYTGTNPQLTDIQSSIDSMIEEIKNSADQQKILNDMLMTVSPEGQLIIDQVNSDVQDVEEGLESIIQGITVPLPEPDDLLPDQDDIMGQYMDSGGSDAVAAVITPIFDENGPIFIMMFAVLSIALISYVLYGKKA